MGKVQKRYGDEFKVEAVKQVVERGRPVADVASRLGVSVDTLYTWVRTHKTRVAETAPPGVDPQVEIRRLKAELQRVTEERDILKKAAAYFAKHQG
jgi:transposase